MNITVWSDFCVPHCYTGEILLVRAIEELGFKKEITIKLRSFELDPGFPKGKTIDVPQCVAQKYHCSLPEALQKIEVAANMGRQAGIDMKFKTAVFCNTRDAHRILKMTEDKYGNDMALKLNFALFDAYFTKNIVLEDKNLVDIASSLGINSTTVKTVLDNNEYDQEVINDEQEAAQNGIYSIPRFEFDKKFAVNGSMDFAGFRSAIKEMAYQNGGKYE